MLPMNRHKMNNKKRVSLRTFKSYKNTRYGFGGRTRTYGRVMRAYFLEKYRILSFNYIYFLVIFTRFSKLICSVTK